MKTATLSAYFKAPSLACSIFNFRCTFDDHERPEVQIDLALNYYATQLRQHARILAINISRELHIIQTYH